MKYDDDAVRMLKLFYHFIFSVECVYLLPFDIVCIHETHDELHGLVQSVLMYMTICISELLIN